VRRTDLRTTSAFARGTWDGLIALEFESFDDATVNMRTVFNRGIDATDLLHSAHDIAPRARLDSLS
jgi:hypothetical protein